MSIPPILFRSRRAPVCFPCARWRYHGAVESLPDDLSDFNRRPECKLRSVSANRYVLEKDQVHVRLQLDDNEDFLLGRVVHQNFESRAARLGSYLHLETRRRLIFQLRLTYCTSAFRSQRWRCPFWPRL